MAEHRIPQGQRPTAPNARSPMRFISVDNVLQYASQIPSGQPRTPPLPPQRPRPARRPSGGGLPNLPSRTTGQQIMPSRTSRVSEKLVLIPDPLEKEDNDDGIGSDMADGDDEDPETDDSRPLTDEELEILRSRGGVRGKSYAERLPKVQRAEKFSRLTAYCTAQAYKMKSTSEFLRKTHDAKTKLYDDCLYTVYHTPLLSGVDGYRVRSRPILKTPGTGKTLLDLEIERNEMRDEHMGVYEDGGTSGSPSDRDSVFYSPGGSGHDQSTGWEQRDEPHGSSPINRLAPDAKHYAELFVFSYGVIVFWNFTEQQEKAILADITFAGNETGGSLVTRPLDRSDVETEEFNFEYSGDIKRPRIFNDMITLLPRSDHMVKISISHAIAQSTKLSFFEEQMSQTMLNAESVPRRLAITGELNMTREEILKIQGRLFKSRVDINLSSNILDVPNFFWDSEPTLHPLYKAIRDYLEIDQRTKVINERCRVFLDLAEILSDSVADSKMSAITWIIIVLIIISICVTVSEVVLRFSILSKERADEDAPGTAALLSGSSSPQMMDTGWAATVSNATIDELRRWAMTLSEQQRGALHLGAGPSVSKIEEL